MNDMAGNAGKVISYDDYGNLVNIEYIDAGGNPTKSNKDHFYSANLRYDERGNQIEVSLRRSNGIPILIAGLCKSVRNSRDERGNGVEGYCIRQDGKLSAMGWAVTKNKFDDDDHQIVEQRYFDRGGRPVLGPTRAFQDSLRYDGDANLAEYAGYGTDGRTHYQRWGFS